jgi:RNA polymerase sigma-70 factor (ECF subfamily)
MGRRRAAAARDHQGRHSDGNPTGNPRLYRRVSFPNRMGTDALLVRRAIDGDERALRSLWSQYAPRVDAVVRRLVGDPDYAADVAQEVWIQIFRALPGFRGDSQFGTWAHRIAVNRTLNALRRTKRMQALETGIEESTASTPPEDERPFLRASIDAATARLAPGARAVFVLHDVEGYTHEEIAKTLGITAGGSKSQLFKARAKLRRLLAHLVEPDATRDGAARDEVAPVAPRSTTNSSTNSTTSSSTTGRTGSTGTTGLGGGIHARVVF